LPAQSPRTLQADVALRQEIHRISQLLAVSGPSAVM
jgi:hypothetical protein